MKRFIAFVLCFWIVFSGPAHAWTVYCTNCSEMATQWLQKAISSEKLAELKAAYQQYVQQTLQQIQILQSNIQQYTNMVKNTVQLPANLIKEVSGELKKLAQITGAINTMRNDIMGMGKVFDELYRAQDELKDLANLPKELMGEGGQQYNAMWDNWSKRVDESTKATFQLTAQQLKDLEDSGQLENYIDRLLSTPDGQQKAIMAGNQLAALHIQEARQLRELIATKFQSDLSSQEKAEKERQMDEELNRKMLDGFKEAQPHPDPF